VKNIGVMVVMAAMLSCWNLPHAWGQAAFVSPQQWEDLSKLFASTQEQKDRAASERKKAPRSQAKLQKKWNDIVLTRARNAYEKSTYSADNVLRYQIDQQSYFVIEATMAKVFVYAETASRICEIEVVDFGMGHLPDVTSDSVLACNPIPSGVVRYWDRP
jgi:hypothetical protein